MLGEGHSTQSVADALGKQGKRAIELAFFELVGVELVGFGELEAFADHLLEADLQRRVVELGEGRFDPPAGDEQHPGLEGELTEGEHPAVDQGHAAVEQPPLGPQHRGNTEKHQQVLADAEPISYHFDSSDIWHTGQRKGSPRATGWLGRGFDALAAAGQADTPGLHLGDGKQPLALSAERVRVPSLGSPDKFRLQDQGVPALANAIRELGSQAASSADPLLGFVQASTSSALRASEQITSALREYQSAVTYPDHGLGQKFKTIAQLILAGDRKSVV